MHSEDTLAAARELQPWLVGIRRRLHMNPELGREEHATADAIEGWLDELKIPHRRTGTAIVGLVSGEDPGRTVALRADIDALPIQEIEGREYRSKCDGRMHACGHDAHTTILLGAARVLSERKDQFAGSVKLLFQPAEETDGGAEGMIQDGCLEDPHVERIYGLHVMPYLPVGSVEIKKGVLFGSSATLTVRIHGRSAHGAYPETGIDAVLIAANVATALNTLVSRCISPLDPAVLTIGTIHGGTASNILASDVEMRATLRTTSDTVREALLARIHTVVEEIPKAYGGSGELAVSYGYGALVNHDAAVEEVEAVAQALLGPQRVLWKEHPTMAVEDFSFFLKARPGAFYHLGCGNPERGITAPLHSAAFDIDEDCLVYGTALQAALALTYLQETPCA